MILKSSVAWNFTNQNILIKKNLTEIVTAKMNHLVLLETLEMIGVQDILEMTAGANPPL